MTDKICHKLINENIKTLCHMSLRNEDNYEKKNRSFNNNMNMTCSSKCEELCNNINDRLHKIKDIVHLRSAKPNAVLIETLIYIKEFIKEIEKYIEVFNNVIYEENRAYAYVEDIFHSLDKQNQNIQKIYHICSQNIVITKNNSELVLQKPQSYSSLSAKFIKNLLNVCEGNENENKNKNDSNNESQNESQLEHQIEGQNELLNESQNENKNISIDECSNENYIN
ncbi:hypothetical protein MKS88_001901 [Plasmodium brasilianum]|uniref:Uncharacterized protein n=2 Tax=Plasmodium (Plasmodium) TaxID=418103 RepID=A0A1A8X2S0_PLAMA|nr:conserved Plasmodium protein, unknown function [Plasmodium malariae]KAI4839352.1 hypothetical protein MKS88_001901 [Plasmodium brasilianum]SBS98896.1 conserved Plasmodium protein, unknown function [Plasmodium malariae]SBT87767.1 conserved Plasmodium protein, unknown function [Plasmodium malariae]